VSTRKRSLQQDFDSAKITFVVGVSDATRAQTAKDSITTMAAPAGSSSSAAKKAMLQNFVSSLNRNMMQAGQAPVRLNIANMKFATPKEIEQNPDAAGYSANNSWSWSSGSTQQQTNSAFNNGFTSTNSGASPAKNSNKNESNNDALLIVLIIVLSLIAAFTLVKRTGAKQATAEKTEAGIASSYQQKVNPDMNAVEMSGIAPESNFD
jgi:hypothetical protein